MKKTLKKFISSFLFLFPVVFTVKAQTNVSGGIFTNTTWTYANSPYIVVDTVVVFPNITLTIEPGVVVKSDNNKRIEIRQGSIIAEGTITDSIKFTSNSASPIPGIWPGILLNGSHFSKFNYCNIFYADQGIYPASMNDTLTIYHSCLFFNNVGLGPIYYSEVYVDSCIFKYNISGVAWAVHSLKMTNSIVMQNQNGILSPESSTYIHCIIDSNSIVGISIQQVDSVIDCEIKYNGIGIETPTLGGSMYITQNIIEENNIGIQLGMPLIQIFCNKICNNTTFDLKSTSNVNSNIMADNYWCSTDSVLISAHIYDGYDNLNLGIINFMPIDTTQCYLTGCNLILNYSVTDATCDTCHNGNATINVTNGFAPFTYTWYTIPIQTNQTAGGLSTGTYTVCVSDAKGCTACNTVFIDSTNCNGFIIHANSSNATCMSCSDGLGWVSINGGTAPYNYTWYTSPIQTTDTASGLLPGTYAVCVIDLFGCSVCDSVNISTGYCSAYFNLYVDTIPHHYYAVNMASGSGPITYSWDWDDGSPFDTIPYPNHTYASSGLYSICLSIIDSVGCTNTYCNSYYLQKTTNTMVFVNVIPPLASGTNDIDYHANRFLIYPNPASNYLIIAFKKFVKKAEVSVSDISGKIIYKTFANETQEFLIDKLYLTEGLYFVHIKTSDFNETKKLIIAK